jgi:hypothetical protein
MPLAWRMSTDAHWHLVQDGVLQPDACQNPENLAELAEAVFQLTGGQAELVRRLPVDEMRAAKPNQGHILLAALMMERAVGLVLSLNFDLAVEHAGSALGYGIKVIDQPGEAVPQTPSVIHLHGHAFSDPERWVLRQEVIENDWRESWEQVIATQVLASPKVIFVGLGSPAPVLSETVDVISAAVQGGETFFQADIVEHAKSQFAQTLGVPPERYIQCGWCELMSELSDRLVREQIHRFQAVAIAMMAEQGLPDREKERLQEVLDNLQEHGLLALGRFRENLNLDLRREYAPQGTPADELLVQPLLTLAEMAQELGLGRRLAPNGVWVLSRRGIDIATVLLATGAGFRTLLALEPRVESTCKRIGQGSHSEPNVVLVSAVRPAAASAAPADIIAEERVDDLISGGPRRLILSLDDGAESFPAFREWLHGR